MSGVSIILNRLNANAALKAVVPSKNMFPVVVPEGALPPFVVVSAIGGSDGVLLGGQGQYPRSRVQIESVGTSFTAADQIAGLVKAALVDIIKIQIPALSVRDVDITFTGLEIDGYNDDRTIFSKLQDYHVQWRRS